MIDELLAPLRSYLEQPDLTVPSLPKTPEGGPAWDFHKGQPSELLLTVPVRVLCKNLQEEKVAAPSYALALAAWMEHATEDPVIVRVRVVGAPPKAATGMLHLRRSLFLLHEYEALLNTRFQVDSELCWDWPRPAIFHVEGDRSQRKQPSQPEDRLAAELIRDLNVRRSFSRTICPIRPFHDKLPMGLFRHEVSKENRWTPGGSSAVDMWAQSTDEQHVHLFELKVKGNRPLGILPEAFYYARMCSVVRSWHRLLRVEPGGRGLEAVRKAKRLTMWLSAPAYHSLVWSPLHRHSAPLAWLNKGLERHQLKLAVLPLSDDPGFAYEDRWPV